MLVALVGFRNVCNIVYLCLVFTLLSNTTSLFNLAVFVMPTLFMQSFGVNCYIYGFYFVDCKNMETLCYLTCCTIARLRQNSDSVHVAIFI